MDIQITFQPTKEHLATIKDWLKVEYDNCNGEGFYCNWPQIESSHSNGRMAVILASNDAIGFAIWYENELTAKLDIVEIKSNLRRNRLGGRLVTSILDYFLSKNIFVVELHCQPASTEKIWKKFGFIEYPKVDVFANLNENSGKSLYKLLSDTVSQGKISRGAETIELWSSETYVSTNAKPNWTWEIKRNKGPQELMSPIIFPCHQDWRIRWKKGNRVIQDDSVKYFYDGGCRYGRFLIIQQL